MPVIPVETIVALGISMRNDPAAGVSVESPMLFEPIIPIIEPLIGRITDNDLRAGLDDHPR